MRATLSPAGRGPSEGLQILSVADLLDHRADSSIRVDLLEQILGGDETVVAALPGRLNLSFEGPAQHFRDLSSAHASHRWKQGAIVQIGDETTPSRLLGLRARKRHDLLLCGCIRQRNLYQTIETSRPHE